MGDVVIRVEHIGKEYPLGQRERYYTLRDKLAKILRPSSYLKGKTPLSRSGNKISKFWALDDVSFEVRRGETIGIIGQNGAGKSTLLKILSRITEPSKGYVDIAGRLGSLLEVGTGFHPELTGRENIYLNGAILGMKKAEITKKFDEIVSFAEVEKFLDSPVKHYSSGMYVRLAFAVAAHLEPEILLVDEVLAVGDAAFQRKCMGKMSDVAEQGRTIIFVSHNMTALLNLCKRSILLERGRIQCVDSTDRVINAYLSDKGKVDVGGWEKNPRRDGAGRIRFKSVEIRNAEGGSSLYPSKPVIFRLGFDGKGDIQSSHVNIGLGINTIFGERVLTLFTKFDQRYRGMNFSFETGTVVKCRVAKLPLSPGPYFLTLYVDIDGEISDRIRDAIELQIHEDDFFGTGVVPTGSQGVYMLEQEWHPESMA